MEAVPPNSFRLGSGLSYIFFSFTPKAVLAVVESPFSLPSRYDMEMLIPLGCSSSVVSLHRVLSCQGNSAALGDVREVARWQLAPLGDLLVV